MIAWLGGLLASAAGRAIGFLLGSSGGASNTDLRDALVQVWGIFEQVVQWAEDIFKAEKSAWDSAAGDINTGAEGLGQVAYNEMVAWQHLLTVILPNTVRWTVGNIHAWADEKYGAAIDGIDAFMRQAGPDIAALKDWRKYTADPDLKAWVDFVTWWNKDAAQPILRWIDFSGNPGDFANWATPPLVGAIIAYLSDPAHKQTRDDLAALMVKAWGEEPGTIADRVNDWLTSAA
jgi:hypothetical protein